MRSSLETTLTDRGQTAVPARIRKHFHLKAGQKLTWIEDGGVILIAPMASDPIASFRGSGKKGLVKALLKSRADDARR